MSGKTVLRIIAGCAAFCLFAMGVLWSAGVQAQEGNGCMPLEKLLKAISGEEYAETPWFVASIRNGQVAIMGYRNEKTGTFTLFARPTASVACPIIDGADLLESDETPAPKAGQGT